MTPRDRFKLLHGPYRCPKCRIGSKLFCEIMGTVQVCGFTQTDFPWPKACREGKGRPPMILCRDLVKAVRRESEVAVAKHWFVSPALVRKWRRALGVAEHNEGTRRLQGRVADGRTDDRLVRARVSSKAPAALAKASAKLKGRIIPPHVIEAARKAAERPRSKEWREKMSAFWRQRGHPPGHPDSRFWTAAEDLLLGTAGDREIARQIGRSTSAVTNRRGVLGIHGHRKQKGRA